MSEKPKQTTKPTIAEPTKPDTSAENLQLTPSPQKPEPKTTKPKTEVKLTKELSREETTSHPEMLLKKKIQSRKEDLDIYKSLKPEKLISPKKPPLVDTAPKRTLVSKEKYQRETRDIKEDKGRARTPPSVTHELPISQPVEKLFQPLAPSSHHLQSKKASVQPVHLPLTEKIPMSLAYTPAGFKPPQQQATSTTITGSQQEVNKEGLSLQSIPVSEEKEVIEEIRMSERVEPVFNGGNTVRRQEDDVDNKVQEEDENEFDLDQIAEDVLPLVKRILEIESERLPRSIN